MLSELFITKIEYKIIGKEIKYMSKSCNKKIVQTMEKKNKNDYCFTYKFEIMLAEY
jgi:hypothetical protein